MSTENIVSQETETKIVNVIELKVMEPTAAVKELTKRIQKYWTVPKSVYNLAPRTSRGFSRILVPYAYPYEPQLVLVHISDNKFAYRFHTLEDFSTNLQPVIKESSPTPKPPPVWCLQCGEAFKKSSYANMHSKKQHKNYYPVYKTSFFLKKDM